MPHTAQKDRASIIVRAVTAWDGDQATVFDPATLAVRKGPGSSLDRLAPEAPLWIDMDLECQTATEWLEPWDAPAARTVNWSDVAGLAGRLGFALPCCGAADDPVAAGLSRLPTINEMAELRWLGQRLGRTEYIAAPLLGSIPTCEIEGVEHGTDETGPLELVLLRVNLLVIDRFMFTIRLPDRLCTGGRALDGGRRVAADVRVPLDKRPKLTVFSHHLRRDGTPTARELGDALGLYLSATCWSAAEHGRTQLIRIERAAKPASADGRDCEDALFAHSERVFELGGALQVAEEELLRVIQRLSEASGSRTRLPVAIRSRYRLALDELRTVERDIRTAIDSLTSRSGQAQRERVRRREKRQETTQAVLAIVGTIVIVPSLIAALYADNVKFAGDGTEGARVRMLLIMVAAVLLVYPLVVGATRLGTVERRPPIPVGVLALAMLLTSAGLFSVAFLG